MPLWVKAIWVQTLQFLYKKNVAILKINMNVTLGKSHLGAKQAVLRLGHIGTALG